MEYIESKRTNLFKNEFLWKAHFKANVYWREDKETWISEEDRIYMKDVDETLNHYAPGEWIRQGAVVYCKTINAIFNIRMRYDEKLIKIEKAII